MDAEALKISRYFDKHQRQFAECGVSKRSLLAGFENFRKAFRGATAADFLDPSAQSLKNYFRLACMAEGLPFLP